MGAAGTDISHAALRERGGCGGGVLLPPPATRVNASGYLSRRCFKSQNALLGEKIDQFFLGKGSKASTRVWRPSRGVSGGVRRPPRGVGRGLGRGSEASEKAQDRFRRGLEELGRCSGSREKAPENYLNMVEN